MNHIKDMMDAYFLNQNCFYEIFPEWWKTAPSDINNSKEFITMFEWAY